MNQLHVYIYPLPLGPPSHFHHPTPLGNHSTEMSSLCSTNTMEYYSVIKKNKIGSFVEMWIYVESVIESEVSQKEKNKYHILTYICGILLSSKCMLLGSLSRHNKDLDRRTLKPPRRVTALGSWTDCVIALRSRTNRVIALREISVTFRR